MSDTERKPRDPITLAEAKALFGVPYSTLGAAVAAGHLKARKSGHTWLTTPEAVSRWLSKAGHRPGPKPGQGVGRRRIGPDAAAAAE